ncbi:MAG: glycosyltransferase family 2 protein [Acidobacteria bacterium]|nr:glycosyltransferase family 2 protein [Acidobacteriota bacterium]MCI0621675.1 glycosyltransferase family 2 protein [Acidobacteriota bacterium]MCI0718263.1 glycosyltransferase family 2 protein [Acidobacteriota bacterium]
MRDPAPVVSVVTPAYNEGRNLALLYQRLCQTLGELNISWEWIVVDDHSADETFSVAAELAQRDPRVYVLRFSRNFGSHTALICGLQQASGDCAIIMAADLQDPPETLPVLMEKWRQGIQVVWAVRAVREGEKTSTVAFARIYYSLMRHFVGLKEMPSTGADFFLMDRRVVEALREFRESHVSLLALITWMGFRQTAITYDKQARLHGRSGWNLEKKLKLVLDSVTSFTYLPIRLMSYVGFLVALVGFFYAGLIVLNYLTGHPVQGWSSLMVAVLVVGGVQMLMMGVLGEYLWRALDESRRRPRYIIEDTSQRRFPSEETRESNRVQKAQG